MGDLFEIQAILVTYCWSISCEIVLRLMLFGFTDDEQTLVQVMAWCREPMVHQFTQQLLVNYGDPDKSNWHSSANG